MDFLFAAVEGGGVSFKALAGITCQSALICIHLNFYKQLIV